MALGASEVQVGQGGVARRNENIANTGKYGAITAYVFKL